MHDIAASKRTAFQARLKNFHRLGFPIDFETSKGKAGVYSPGHMVEMALALEMTQLGLSPERVVRILAGNGFPTYMALNMAASALYRSPAGFDPDTELETDPLSMFLYFEPAALRALMLDDAALSSGTDQADDTFFYGGIGVVRENLVKWTSGPLNRIALINVTAMVDMLAKAVCPCLEDEPAALEWLRAFYLELTGWADEKIEETYEHEAEHFLARLLANRHVVPEEEQVEAFLAQLVEETGFKPETVHSAFLKWATDHHGALLSRVDDRRADNGDR